MRSYALRLAIVERLLQNLCESGVSCILGRLLLVLSLLPLMWAPSLSLTLTQALHPRRHPLAGVHGQSHILLPLPQAQLSAVTASQTRG